MAGCTAPPEPDKVKKVEDCVALFRSQKLQPQAAPTAAVSLIEEAALTEEAVDATCRCFEQLDPATPHRGVLVSELLNWIKTWDNEGRPKYLAQFFRCFAQEEAAFEARQMAAAAFQGRLERVEKDEHTGLRAVLVLLTKALGDRQFCVSLEGRDPEGQSMPLPRTLQLFAGTQQVNAWLASGLELKATPSEDCPASVRVEMIGAGQSFSTPLPGSAAGSTPAAPQPQATPATGPRARVSIARSGIIVFDKEYNVDPKATPAFPDFLIP
jgi:hypothetical protein